MEWVIIIEKKVFAGNYHWSYNSDVFVIGFD